MSVGSAALTDATRGRLPLHHVRRPRLTDRCRGERLIVVEAAAGYGKSVLAAELVSELGSVPVWVLLESGGVSASLFTARLRAGLAAAGLRDAAGVMAQVRDDPVGAVDAVLELLAAEAVLFVVDDVHHAEPDAAALVDRIAVQLRAQQCAIVLGRYLPAGLERLRRAEAVLLAASDLALDSAETAEVCRSGFGLDVSDAELARLEAFSDGWTAATVLAASRAKRTTKPLGSLLNVVEGREGPLRTILDGATSALGWSDQALAQIGIVPLLDARLLALVTGDPSSFNRALAAGMPLSPARAGWWELPGPVRDQLAGLADPDPETLLSISDHYRRHGELGTALHMLLAADQAEAAAQLLDGTDLRALETVDVLELLSVLDRIPAHILDAYPRAILWVARMCGMAALLRRRETLMRRLDGLIDESSPGALRRLVEVERLIDLTNGPAPQTAEAPALGILETAEASEQLTRARALNVVGLARFYRRDSEGRLTADALREAGSYLEQACELYVALGYPIAASGLAPHRAIWIELNLGRTDAALAILNSALEATIEHPWRLMRNLFYRSQVLTELGLFDEAQVDLSEVDEVAHRVGDRTMSAYVSWQKMIIASLRGDGDAALLHARQTEVERGEWWNVAGAHFLADAAESLDRLDEHGLATDYLERAARDPQNAARVIAMARCALAARHGDPVEAESLLQAVDREGIAPREVWRVTLLRAYAAYRQGGASTGDLAARAFEEAARLGQPRSPLLRERAITDSLLALALETAMPAARALDGATLPISLGVLGGFRLSHGGRAISIGSNQEMRLLKFVAVRQGTTHVEQAIDALWPEAGADAGRNRLRTVLNRLRAIAPDVVRREGETLALGPDVRLDLAQFHADARRAHALQRDDPPAALLHAHAAIARYAGDVLAHDPYEPWADEPRYGAQRTMLDLLDLCAEAAAVRGDIDEARRMVGQAIELEPQNDARYLRIASTLAAQGSRGAALSILRRARSALERIGIEPPSELDALEQSLAYSRHQAPAPEHVARRARERSAGRQDTHLTRARPHP